MFLMLDYGVKLLRPRTDTLIQILFHSGQQGEVSEGRGVPGNVGKEFCDTFLTHIYKLYMLHIGTCFSLSNSVLDLNQHTGLSIT